MNVMPSRRTMLAGTIGGGLIAAIGAGSDAAVGPTPLSSADPGSVEGLALRLIHKRRAWRARPPKRRIEVINRRPDHIVIHHTDTANTANRSLGHAFELSRQIQRFHMDGRGWNDIGEQITISRGGHVMEGRAFSLPAIVSGRHVIGAQTLHHNTHTIGIENEGNYTRAVVPAALWASLTQACVLLCMAYRLNPYKAIVGHRDFNNTTCPGDALYARLPALRRTVANRLKSAAPRSNARLH
jgi:hypothetical protein